MLVDFLHRLPSSDLRLSEDLINWRDQLPLVDVWDEAWMKDHVILSLDFDQTAVGAIQVDSIMEIPQASGCQAWNASG